MLKTKFFYFGSKSCKHSNQIDIESYQKGFLNYVCLVLTPRTAMTTPVIINIIWPINDKLFPLVNA